MSGPKARLPTRDPASPRRSIRRATTALAGSGLLVAASLGIMNALSYAFTVIAARRLGPTAFGAFASLMGLIIVVNVAAMGLQAAAARWLAAPRGDRLTTVRAVRVVTAWCAAGTFGLLLVLGPALNAVLDLHSWGSTLMLAAAGATLAIFGGQIGLLQGFERWRGYAVVYVLFGVTRLALGWAGIRVRPDLFGAMAGVTVGLAITVLVGALVARPLTRAARGAPAPTRRAERGLLKETLIASSTLFAYFALSSADVLIARSFLPALDAGLYAGGQILAKAVLFLPFFVTVVAYPRLARNAASRLHLYGLGLVVLIGGCVVAAAAALPHVALLFIGGAAYAGVSGQLWLFALLGTILAGVQLLVMATIARRSTRAAWILWVAIGVLTGSAFGVHTWSSLVWVVTAVDGAVLLALLALTWSSTGVAGSVSGRRRASCGRRRH